MKCVNCYECKRSEKHNGNWYCRIGHSETLRCSETIFTELCRPIDEYDYWQCYLQAGEGYGKAR